MTAPFNPHDPPIVDVRPGASSAGEDPSVGELFGQLTSDMGTLVRKEIELARIELKEEIGKAGKAGGILGATAVAGYLALLMLSFALAWGLAEVIPAGFAFLIVALIYAAIAAAGYTKGRAELEKVNPTPTQTVETLKEDAQWASQLRK